MGGVFLMSEVPLDGRPIEGLMVVAGDGIFFSSRKPSTLHAQSYYQHGSNACTPPEATSYHGRLIPGTRRLSYPLEARKCVFLMSDCQICISHADGLLGCCETVIKCLKGKGHVELVRMNGFDSVPFFGLEWTGWGGSRVQGHLAHKKQPPFLGPP